VLVVVLIGAAFLAGRLLNGQKGLGTGPNLIGNPAGGMSGAVQAVQIEMGEPPEELPRTAPDTTGLFVKRADNVLTVGTIPEGSGGSVSITTSSEGNTVIDTGPKGPEVEVVVTKETKVYRDATFDDLKGGMPDPNQKIQQKVAEATLDEIGESSFVTAWGRKSGDRIIADVLFFTSPMVFKKAQ
jgi:hypothetical protein